MHLILLRKRFKKLDKCFYTIDFSKEMVYISVRMRETSPLNEIKDKGVLQKEYLEKCLFLLERKRFGGNMLVKERNKDYGSKY